MLSLLLPGLLALPLALASPPSLTVPLPSSSAIALAALNTKPPLSSSSNPTPFTPPAAGALYKTPCLDYSLNSSPTSKFLFTITLTYRQHDAYFSKTHRYPPVPGLWPGSDSATEKHKANISLTVYNPATDSSVACKPVLSGKLGLGIWHSCGEVLNEVVDTHVVRTQWRYDWEEDVVHVEQNWHCFLEADKSVEFRARASSVVGDKSCTLVKDEPVRVPKPGPLGNVINRWGWNNSTTTCEAVKVRAEPEKVVLKTIVGKGWVPVAVPKGTIKGGGSVPWGAEFEHGDEVKGGEAKGDGNDGRCKFVNRGRTFRRDKYGVAEAHHPALSESQRGGIIHPPLYS